jgi:uncharacterized damage-inducible protein DinB
MPTKPEVWMRGPVPDVPALLQPVAHSLLQCNEEVEALVPTLSAEQIWARPSRAASIGFHIRHAAGSLDRLFTYARGEQLSSEQRAALATEGEIDPAPDAGAKLLTQFAVGVERALAQLRATDEKTLLDFRGIGRAQLPSTVMGVLFHAAEHTQRHLGQATTTARMLA